MSLSHFRPASRAACRARSRKPENACKIGKRPLFWPQFFFKINGSSSRILWRGLGVTRPASRASRRARANVFKGTCLHGLLYGNAPADTYCNVTSINGDVTVTDGCNGDCYCDWLEEVFTTGENVQIIVDFGNFYSNTSFNYGNFVFDVNKQDVTDDVKVGEEIFKKIFKIIMLNAKP